MGQQRLRRGGTGRILAHETAGHIGGDHDHRRDIARRQRETEAARVAYLVLAVPAWDIGSSAVECVATEPRDTDLLGTTAGHG